MSAVIIFRREQGYGGVGGGGYQSGEGIMGRSGPFFEISELRWGCSVQVSASDKRFIRGRKRSAEMHVDAFRSSTCTGAPLISQFSRDV